ncbi:hypothetical protein [uncultured Sulfitobacter sp.]|uniref:calcium-binding protein n=1 Tax=uncultured Sulfitobacter sp. TaxID=191468 RepID=UPI00260389BB|nr:hypothetical protein [uncultured Sulfitobacter sp.]
MQTPVFFDFDLSNLDTDETGVDHPRITALQDGGFFVASTMESGNTFAAAATILNADGTTRVPFFEVSPDTLGRQIFNDATLLSNGNVVVGWHATYDGRLPNKFDAYGAVTAVITPQGAVLSETFHGYGREPVVAALANGSYGVAWWAHERWAPYDDGDGAGIFGQRVAADGTIGSARTQINTTTINDQNFPTIAALSGGNMVVAWESSPIGEGGKITSIIVDASFSAVTSERDLFTFQPGETASADIVSLANGGFAASSTQGIRIFNADGTLRADVSDTFETGSISGGSLAALPSGGFVAVVDARPVWDTIGDSANYQILGQRFNADGTRDGNFFRIDYGDTPGANAPEVAVLSGGSLAIAWGNDADTPTPAGRIISSTEPLGGPQDDILRGTAAADHLYGWEGDDVLIGAAGNDTLDSGGGADLIGADLGDDVMILSGQTQHAAGYMAFNVSSSTQTGTQMRVSIEGYTKLEAVSHAGAGIDTIQLGSGNEAFFLHDAFSDFNASARLVTDSTGKASTARFAGVERIEAFDGDDIIDLTSPDYSLAGLQIEIEAGEGDDLVWGSDANEVIHGGGGDDTIFGGAGLDMISGGAGADVFEFTRSATDTTIDDFNTGEGDSLRFYNTGNAVFDAASAEVSAGLLSISYTDTVTNTDQRLSIVFLDDAQGVLDAIEII